MSDNNDDDKHLSAGAIVGITLGCVFFVIVVIVIIYICVRGRAAPQSHGGPTGHASTTNINTNINNIGRLTTE